MQYRNANTTVATVLLLVCLLLAGCLGGGSGVVRYYLIDPVEYPVIRKDGGQTLVIEITDLHIPQYLERFHIATRVGANQLKYAEFDQWGENLRKNLLRTLARNLSRLLRDSDVATPLNRSASGPDYRLRVHIEQFEQDMDGTVRLTARWQLSAGIDGEPLGLYAAELQGGAVDNGDYAGMVSEMQALYGDLSSRIADSISGLNKG